MVKDTIQVAPFFQHLCRLGYSLALLCAGWFEFSFKLEYPACPMLSNRGLQFGSWAPRSEMSQCSLSRLSALLLDVDFSSDFFLPQLSFCWLSEIACKRGERPLSLIESTSVGEGAGGYNLNSGPNKSKKQQKILYREWSSTLSGTQSKDVCWRILTQENSGICICWGKPASGVVLRWVSPTNILSDKIALLAT